MALHTRLTEMLRIEHPVISAPMAFAAGGKLAAAVMLSFGSPMPFAHRIKAPGAGLICQIQSMELAREAIAAGADVIVAQGAEAGGHGMVRARVLFAAVHGSVHDAVDGSSTGTSVP